MRVVTFRGEASLAAISTKVYGKLTGNARKAAEAALLRANPQLGKLADVKPGTVLHVPEVGDLRAKPGSGLEDPVIAGSAVLLQHLDALARKLGEHHEAYQTALKEQAALLKDRDLRKAIGDSAELQQRVKNLAGELGDRGKAAEASRKRLDAAVEKLKADLPQR